MIGQKSFHDGANTFISEIIAGETNQSKKVLIQRSAVSVMLVPVASVILVPVVSVMLATVVSVMLVPVVSVIRDQ
jgi:hypothetical protein